MRPLRFVWRFILVLVAIPVVVALVVGLPLGFVYLLSFASEWVELLIFVPGFAMYVLGFCVPVGLVQFTRWQAGRPSTPFRLPGSLWLATAAVASIGVGYGLLSAGVAVLFWPVFVLAAALPPLTALGLALQRIGTLTTWRRALAGVLSGSLLSTYLTILLTVAVSLLAYALLLPLREVTANLLASPDLERLFYSPVLALTLVEAAVVAPLVEELTKPVGAILLARRLRGPAEAFLVGMAGGVGFAIIENMLYEAAGAQAWAGIATLRAVGGALHPLNAGLVAIGWYGVRNGLPGAWRRLLGLYGLAVGAHALWNGGLVLLLSDVGAYFFGAETWQLDVVGVGQPGVVLVFMLLEALALWRLVAVVSDHLREPGEHVEALLALHTEQPRRLALWASGLLIVAVSIGALYGPLVGRWAERLSAAGG
jgi:RsiW-degrading membrane proteinase PrsW (M82 family)